MYEDRSGYGNMNDFRSSRVPSDSIQGKLQRKFWKTKQVVLEKLGKEQDQHVVACDSELDAKLQAYKHVKLTCAQLMISADLYQARIWALSQDENDFGRFLKEQGANDKSKAGRMMVAVGKTQAHASQLRLQLRQPLERLYHELETFCVRAIADTALTVKKMETQRSNYRAGLLWMADISKELDPDVDKRLDKFREVQIQVKMAKAAFEKLKVDVIQKIDLLSASRCNLLSLVLANYQQTMLAFFESSSQAYTSILDKFWGPPSYRFTALKNILGPNNGIEEDDDLDSTEHKVEAIRDPNKTPPMEDEEHFDPRKPDRSPPTMLNTKKASSSSDEQLIALGDDSDCPSKKELENPFQSAQSHQMSDILDMCDLSELKPTTSFLDQFTASGPDSERVLTDLKKSCRITDGMVELETAESNRQPTCKAAPMKTEDLLSLDQSSEDPTGVYSEMMQIFGEPGSAAAENAAAAANASQEASFTKAWYSLFGSEQNAVTSSSNFNLDSAPAASSKPSGYLPSSLMDFMARPSATDKSDLMSFPASNGSSRTGVLPKDLDKKKADDLTNWLNMFSELDPLSGYGAAAKKSQKGSNEAC